MKMKFRTFLQAAILLLIAAGAPPAYSAFWQWSKTSSNNATADPSINWSEGMSPSSVNDSARAMMARAAEYRDDISGLLATGGTSAAYTVTTNQGLNATPDDGQLLSVTMHATNGSAATLRADGGTAFPIQSSPGAAAPAGTLIAGSPYTVKFSALNSAWMLRNFYGSALTVPLGGMVPYTLGTVPNSNFIFPAGQCLSTTTYLTYWVALGSPASGGCPGGQFAVIDLRGRALVALDNLNGSAASRLTSSITGCGTAMTSVGASCANGVEGSAISLAQLPAGITSSGNNSISVTSQNSLVKNAALGINPGPASATPVWFSGSSGSEISTNGAQAISVTSNNTSGQVRPQVMPAIAVTYLLRVL